MKEIIGGIHDKLREVITSTFNDLFVHCARGKSTERSNLHERKRRVKRIRRWDREALKHGD